MNFISIDNYIINTERICYVHIGSIEGCARVNMVDGTIIDIACKKNPDKLTRCLEMLFKSTSPKFIQVKDYIINTNLIRYIENKTSVCRIFVLDRGYFDIDTTTNPMMFEELIFKIGKEGQ